MIFHFVILVTLNTNRVVLFLSQGDAVCVDHFSNNNSLFFGTCVDMFSLLSLTQTKQLVLVRILCLVLIVVGVHASEGGNVGFLKTMV